MYQIHSDIFRKIALYVKIARQFKEDIKKVGVSNKIKEHFGKLYCRVYIHIELKEHSSLQYELQEELWNNLTRYGESEYFSFYLPGGYRQDSDDRLRNIEENTHYDYIWNLLAWYLQQDAIIVDAAEFISQKDLKYEEQQRDKKYCQERQLIESAVENLIVEVGQFIALKSYSGPLRIGRIEKVTLPEKRKSFSVEVYEIKKDFTPGKNEIRVWAKTDIYAIVEPRQLPKGKSKTDLIASIECGENFEGLIWRRPQVLWK